MSIVRGSTHKLVTIPEATFGTTPATPVMLETPITNLTKKSTQTVLRSNQIRSHPFVDRLMYGQFVHDLSVDFELQDGSHDTLIETMFGDTTFASKAITFNDTLLSLSAESQTGGTLADFDQYTGWFFNKFSVSASASDTAPVKASLTGLAKTGTLDATTSIATSVTAASFVDPFIFADSTLSFTVGGVTTVTALMTGNFDISRKVDPLMLWGSRVPREYVPSDVTATASLTIPYDTANQSGLVVGFTDVKLTFKFANVGATTFRTFVFPKSKLTDIARPVANRGGIMQTITAEPYYDSATGTIATMTTE